MLVGVQDEIQMEPLARRKFYLHRCGNPAAGGLWVVNPSRAANIDNEKSRPASPHCAKVGVAASALANLPSLSNLQDAHSLMKQFWKMAKKEMCYRNFNHGSGVTSLQSTLGTQAILVSAAVMVPQHADTSQILLSLEP